MEAQNSASRLQSISATGMPSSASMAMALGISDNRRLHGSLDREPELDIFGSRTRWVVAKQNEMRLMDCESQTYYQGYITPIVGQMVSANSGMTGYMAIFK